MSFLPENYEAPKSNNSNYMKLVEGENRIRIMSRPIFGWEDWLNNKPIRFTMDKKPAKQVDPKKAIKHLWAFVVFNYQQEQLQILQITQASIRKSLEALCKDSDWGDPYAYDIKIVKTGEGVDTEYSVNPVPHKPVDDYLIKCFEEKPCYLEALFEGADPFSPEWGPDKKTQRATGDKKIVDIKDASPAFTADMAKKKVGVISAQEATLITESLSKCSDEYVSSVLEFMKRHGISTYSDLTKEVYDKIMLKASEDKEKKAKKG